jgi:hypothetical protein
MAVLIMRDERHFCCDFVLVGEKKATFLSGFLL